MSPFVKVTAAVIIENQQVLITQRHADDEMGGKWEFPGGKIEPGETPEACLQRELQEELDILVDVYDTYAVTRHSYPHINIELLAYKAKIRSGQIALHTHKDYRWIPIYDLEMVDFSDADKLIVKKLIQDFT